MKLADEFLAILGFALESQPDRFGEVVDIPADEAALVGPHGASQTAQKLVFLLAGTRNSGNNNAPFDHVTREIEARMVDVFAAVYRAQIHCVGSRPNDVVGDESAAGVAFGESQGD